MPAHRRPAFLPPWVTVALAAACAAGCVAPAPAHAAKKVRCKAGTVPVVTGAGPKAKLAKTKSGKPRCVKLPKPVQRRVEPPATSSQGAVASAADGLTQALTVDPAALAKIERKVGKKATKALVDRTLNGWRSGMQARRLADDAGIHLNQTFGDPAKGTQGTAKLDASDVNAGGKLGFQASATVEFSADGKGLKELGADKVTDAKSAKVKLEVSFEDAPAGCPTAEGKVDGKLAASAKITITTDGVSQTISAKVDASYALTVGDDARWKTIDSVDVSTEFQFGGTGQKTSTWRGRRVGGGFTDKGIFGAGSGDFGQAIAEQASHIDPSAGGIFGPQSSVNFAKGETPWDYKSISNIKGMIYTDIATTYLTYAAVEYIRKVVADRLQKNWYDKEACLKLEGKPAASKLRAGQSTNVTASNAKAASGAPVAVSLKASGVASLEPAAASMAAGGAKDFKLTAPNATPTSSSWTIVGTGKAGKKTVSGTLGDQPKYTVTLDDLERGVFATHDASATLTGSLTTVLVDGSNPATSTATGPATWSPLASASKVDTCSIINPVSAGTWSVTITESGPDTISVMVDFTRDTAVDYTFHCVEPPTPGCGCGPVITDNPLTGPRPIAFPRTPFTLPASGGTLPVEGEITVGGDGLFSKGTVTVTPTG